MFVARLVTTTVPSDARCAALAFAVGLLACWRGIVTPLYRREHVFAGLVATQPSNRTASFAWLSRNAPMPKWAIGRSVLLINLIPILDGLQAATGRLCFDEGPWTRRSPVTRPGTTCPSTSPRRRFKAYLGLKKTNAYEAIKALPHLRMGRLIRIPKESPAGGRS